MFIRYFLARHKTDILQIMTEEDVSKHYSVNINFLELFTADANLGNSLLSRPAVVLGELDYSLLLVQQQLLEENDGLIVKQNIHTRVYGVPVCPELHKSLLPGNEDLGSFLQVSGTVVRITLPKMLEFQRQYICAKCKYKMLVHADLEQRYIVVPPKNCANPEMCKGTTFITDEKFDCIGNCKDYQEIKIQEQLSKLGMGKVPSSMWITVEDDLVDVCKPGDNVTICGIVKRRWKPQYVGKELNVELFLKANHIQVNNDDNSLNLLTPDIREQHENFWIKHSANPLEGRDVILKSICPEIYGLFIVKLALAVVLTGGSQLKEDESTITPRSQPHLLLVGDPGTGKSQLLRFATKVIRRSVFTTGIGSTSAGLTVTAVMEDGEWQLEGGALVMADGGICCIDEFNSMKKQDRASIHEAMEQQTISVAKAGVVCKLHTRCTVIAATNPKGGIDSSQPFGMNINIASPLLSRFDVVLHLKDKIDSEWDGLVADYVLNAKKSVDDCNKNEESSVWSIGRLQSYFIMIKQLNPVLTPIASQILSSYYQAQRVIASRNKARTTVRLLDSLIRLSQGHARLMYHKEVQITDAIIAVILVEASLQGDSSLLALNDMNADFPENPSVFQRALNMVVLERLDLMHLLQIDVSDKSVASVSSGLDDSDENGGEVIENSDLENSSEQEQMETESEVQSQREGKRNSLLIRNENRFSDEEDSTDDFLVFKTQNHDTRCANIKKSSQSSSILEKPKKANKSAFQSIVEVPDDVDLSGDTKGQVLPVLQKSPIDDGQKKQSSNMTKKLELFRFKPREVENSDNNAVDINQMLNMLPSVAEDFNVEEMDLADVDISEQSFISDD